MWRRRELSEITLSFPRIRCGGDCHGAHGIGFMKRSQDSRADGRVLWGTMRRSRGFELSQIVTIQLREGGCSGLFAVLGG